MDLAHFTDVLGDADEIGNSQPLSLSISPEPTDNAGAKPIIQRSIDSCSRMEKSARRTGQQGEFRSVEEIDQKYRDVFSYPYFNLVQSRIIDDALYTDKSMVVCAPTGSGKTVIFEMAIVQLLMELDDRNYTGDFKIIYMAPVKALCTERLSEWYPKFTKLGLMCIEVTGDTNVDFSQLKPYRIIITTPEKWDILTRRWRDHKSLVEVIKLFLIDEVHILNDDSRGPVLEAVVSRMKTIESSSQTAHRIEQLQKQYQTNQDTQDQEITSKINLPIRIRFVAVSATVSNPEDVAAWLGASDKPAVFYKFGDECRPVKLKRVVEGYPCSEGTSIFKFDIILNYKLWPIIQKYHDGKSTLIFCNTRKSVTLTAETLSRELTISVTPEQQARLTSLASTIKNKKLQALVMNGVGCHHAGLLFEERVIIEEAFRNRDLPILITTTTLAMGVNLPAHLVIIKNTQQYVNGAYQEYSISTVLQMVGRAGRPQFDTDATAVIMTRLQDKHRYQALVGGDEPLQSYLHKRLAENLNSEAALGTVCDVAQCVQWLQSTFLSVRAPKDPRRYLGLPQNAAPTLISKKIEELCVKAMNSLASSGLITMDEASCIESTEAGRLMSVFYLDLETMKHIMKIEGSETLEKLLWIVCECHELADMHLRVDERRTLNTLNRNNAAATIRFPMKGKISTRQMKLNCIIQAILGCLPIPDPSLNQEAMKVMRIADRVCKCLVAYVTRSDLISVQTQYYTTVVNALILAKCIEAHLWENSPYVSKQLKGIGPTFSSLLATAGKVNFTLLEESHPRDLERIMNKGAPAGNVLRKQISFLPKYQLTATPIDERRISIQLLLLNQHQLTENREQLTAGDSHKCYVVVGDSENYLLLFTSFKDKDLISVYDGVITYEVTRKQSFEHKVIIHCISANWVGIDVQCDYLFKNIEPPLLQGEAKHSLQTQHTQRKACTKQTSITDIYKERKRKNNDIDITESKEKKKRNTALLEKFKFLKNSFEITSKEMREDLVKSAQMSSRIINGMIQPINNNIINRSSNIVEIIDDVNDSVYKTASLNNEYDYPKIDGLDSEENVLVDDHINNILNEIESEIVKSNDSPMVASTNDAMSQRAVHEQLNTSSFFTKPLPKCPITVDNGRPQISSINNFPNACSTMSKSCNEKKKTKPMNTRNNYSFIDTIEKNIELDNDINSPKRDSGFSEAIKRDIEKFLQRTANIKQDDVTIKKLLGCTDHTEQLGLNPRTENLSNKYSDTKLDIPLSLELPAISINQITNKSCEKSLLIAGENNHQEDKDLVEKKSMDIFTSHNVQNINKMVENIELEYNLSTKKSDKKQGEHDNCKKHQMQNCNCFEILASKSEENDCTNNIYIKEQCQYRDIITSTKKVMENHDDAPRERNIPVKKSANDLENEVNIEFDQLPIEYFYKSIKPRPFVDRVATKLCLNKDIRDKSLYNSDQPLYIMSQSQYLPSSSKELIPLNDKSHEKINKVVSIQNEEELCNENGTKNISSLLSAPNGNYSSFRHNNNIQFNQNSEEPDKEHINRYSLSATKIDVCTKNLPDHQIQIIRKLKLNLDVTEIVSKENNKSTTETKTSDKHYQINDEKGNLSLQDQHYVESSSIVEGLQNFDINKAVAMGDIENNKHNSPEVTTKKPDVHLSVLVRSDGLRGKQKSINKVESVKETEINKKHIPEMEEKVNEGSGDASQLNEFTTSICQLDSSKANNRIENNIIYLPETKVTINKEAQKTSELQKVVCEDEDLEQYKKYLREIAIANAVKGSVKSILSEKEKKDTIYNVKSLETENVNIENKNQSDETKSNKIENILQKYRKILRKSSNILNTAGNNIPNHDVTRQTLEKTKKPYKISDIQKLHIPLPKSLTVGASRTPRTTDNDILTKMRDIAQSEQTKTFKRNFNTQENMETKNNKNIAYIEDSFTEDVPEYLSTITELPQAELTENYDLDQSMLNPKTLLEQCFSKDERKYDDVIIPPPPEFCNRETVYSPVKLQDDLIVHLTSQESNATEVFSTKYAHNESIFEDNNFSVLTPSVEIETWTLTRDNEDINTTDGFRRIQSQNNYIFHDTEESTGHLRQIHSQCNKSCIVMRRKPSASRDNFEHSKLGNFKFTHKKKFRM